MDPRLRCMLCLSSPRQFCSGVEPLIVLTPLFRHIMKLASLLNSLSLITMVACLHVNGIGFAVEIRVHFGDGIHGHSYRHQEDYVKVICCFRSYVLTTRTPLRAGHAIICPVPVSDDPSISVGYHCRSSERRGSSKYCALTIGCIELNA